MEQLWSHLYKKELRVEASEHALFYTEYSWNSKENREKLLEMALETFQVPAFYLGKNPVLSW